MTSHVQRSTYLFNWHDRINNGVNTVVGRLRQISDVTGLVLHQTSFNRGNDTGAYDRINAHFVILPNGTTVTKFDETENRPCSGGFNSYTVGVEFVGNFPMDSGRWWKGNSSHDMPTWAQIHSGRCLVNYLQNAVGITHVFAHRQTVPGNRRSNCPGPHIWYNVGEWAMSRGLSDGGLGYAIKGGNPIPELWREQQFDLYA